MKEASGHEYDASLRTNAAIERAEACVMVVDGSNPISEQDLRIITLVAEAGHVLAISFNKWDLVHQERPHYLDREVERDLVRAQWAPAHQHHRQAPAGTSTGWCPPSTRPCTAVDPVGTGALTRSSAGGRGTRTRSAAASSRRSCSAPRPPPSR